LQKKYLIDSVKQAYNRSVKERGSPQAVAMSKLIDIHYLPVVMTAQYTRNDVKKLKLGGRNGDIDRQAEYRHRVDGTDNIMCLVSGKWI
jgi:hypothetical protein